LISERVLKVYRALPMDGFQWLLPVLSEDSLKLRFDGTPRSKSWIPIPVERVTEDVGLSLPDPSDFPSGCGFVVSQVAKEKLRPCLEQSGELLPLECPDGEFWTLNVTRLVDALDEEGSEVLRASDSGEILMIHRHRFRAERLGPEIFKLSQTPRGLIYFTEAFVHRVRATSLKGLDFKLVWAAN
jgi:hypothetical protein